MTQSRVLALFILQKASEIKTSLCQVLIKHCHENLAVQIDKWSFLIPVLHTEEAESGLQ